MERNNKKIASKKQFYDLHDKAISPPQKSKARKSAPHSSADSTGKQPRRYKSAKT